MCNLERPYDVCGYSWKVEGGSTHLKKSGTGGNPPTGKIIIFSRYSPVTPGGFGHINYFNAN
jgi:hypothetical protein